MKKNRPPFSTDLGTRDRILESAWSLIDRLGVSAVTLADIARAAGVSRQTLYLHFGTRAGVLVAMVRHRDAESTAVKRIRKARQLSSPVEALERYVRAWCRYIPEILLVARALSAAAPTDEAARLAWEDRMKLLRSGIHQIIERLAADGMLAKGWLVDEATAWCWSQIHIDNWHHLVIESGWPERKYVDRLVNTVLTLLIRGSRKSSEESK